MQNPSPDYGAPRPSVVPCSILVPPPDGAWTLILGPGLPVNLHWMGRRTLPCLRDDCPKARHMRPVTWCCYYPGLLVPGGAKNPDPAGLENVLVPLSDVVQEEAEEQRLAGNTLWHVRPGRKGRGIGVVNARRIAKTLNVPPPFNVDAVLRRIWGMFPAGPPSRDPDDGEVPNLKEPSEFLRAFREDQVAG